MLEVRQLSKAYSKGSRSVQALDAASLEVAAGEFVAVRGSSGCGKTTLLLTVGGLMAPDSGRVTLAGADPYSLSPETRARFRAENIGFVFQQYYLVPYLTVLQNVLCPSLAVRSDGAQQRAEELIHHFGLNDRIDHVATELSTGERQRTALARALLNSPKLLLADEPTGNLDEENAGIVLEYLAEFARAGGTVLLVTHDPRTAEFAHKTILMRNGRCEPFGPDGAARV